MVFNSLLMLAETDRKGVFKFLQEVCYSVGYELTQDEKAFIYNALIEYSKKENKNFDNLLSMFTSKQNLYDIFIELKASNSIGFFTSREKVYMASLDKRALYLTVRYLALFGFGNIQN